MTQVEEGRLSLANDIPWALNKISMSQVVVFNSQSVTSQQKVKICRYYNDFNMISTMETTHFAITMVMFMHVLK